jgi:hypothetical protein
MLPEANLVVIEIKRTDDGGHMDLQAIRYAAMVSSLTFEDAVEAHRRFLDRRKTRGDARSRIRSFLGTLGRGGARTQLGPTNHSRVAGLLARDNHHGLVANRTRARHPLHPRPGPQGGQAPAGVLQPNPALGRSERLPDQDSREGRNDPENGGRETARANLVGAREEQANRTGHGNRSGPRGSSEGFRFAGRAHLQGTNCRSREPRVRAVVVR